MINLSFSAWKTRVRAGQLGNASSNTSQEIRSHCATPLDKRLLILAQTGSLALESIGGCKSIGLLLCNGEMTGF